MSNALQRSTTNSSAKNQIYSLLHVILGLHERMTGQLLIEPHFLQLLGNLRDLWKRIMFNFEKADLMETKAAPQQMPYLPKADRLQHPHSHLKH
jgi:hypothetical protein